MDSNHDIAPLPPLRAEFAGGTFRGITTRKDGTHCAVILLPNKATERRNWQACVDWANEAGGELPTRPVFHLLRLSATKEELAEGGWYYTADLLSDDTGDEDDASHAGLCCLSYGGTLTTRKSYEGLAVAVRLIPLTSPAKVGGDGLIEQHARDSTELRRLCAARDEARRTAEYWKANHLAGNAEIERLKKLLEAKVGGDEREGWRIEARADGPFAVKTPKGRSFVSFPENPTYELVEFVRAALSADGGEDKRDAERLSQIAWLIASIFVHGGFKAETHNERELERLLRENGTFFESVAEYDAAIAANQAKGEA